jgi:deazaflavin-dependent oxidoreductase (nitroreductase family)
MRTWIVGTVAGVAALTLAWVLTLRTKFPPGMAVIRALGRWVVNPRILRTAGSPGARASVIRHVGRKSGKPYATAIGVTPTDDGVVVMLPYGRDVDWVRNVLAAGTAVIETEGRAVRVVEPRLAGRHDVDRYLSAGNRLEARLFAVDDYLVLRRSDDPAA